MKRSGVVSCPDLRPTRGGGVGRRGQGGARPWGPLLVGVCLLSGSGAAQLPIHREAPWGLPDLSAAISPFEEAPGPWGVGLGVVFGSPTASGEPGLDPSALYDLSLDLDGDGHPERWWEWSLTSGQLRGLSCAPGGCSPLAAPAGPGPALDTRRWEEPALALRGAPAGAGAWARVRRPRLCALAGPCQGWIQVSWRGLTADPGEGPFRIRGPAAGAP